MRSPPAARSSSQRNWRVRPRSAWTSRSPGAGTAPPGIQIATFSGQWRKSSAYLLT